MNQDRQIRFIVAPFLLFVSLWWDGYITGNGSNLISHLGSGVTPIIAVGAAAIPAGFIIGTFSVVILNCIFKCRGKASYEPYIEDRKLISKAVKLSRSFFSADPENLTRDLLYSSATFDHEILDEGIHNWLTRRWLGFNISVNCITAIILSHIAFIFLVIANSDSPGVTYEVCQLIKDVLARKAFFILMWFVPNVALFAVLFIHAKMSRQEIYTMIEFQARRYGNKARKI